MDMKAIGARLRAARLAMRPRMTQFDLAKKTGKPPTTISRWENGSQAIETENLEVMCKALNVSVSDVLDPSQPGGGSEVHTERVQRLLGSEVVQQLDDDERRALALILKRRDIPEWRALAALEMLFRRDDG